MVDSPDRYPWSSFRYHAWGEENRLIQDHNIYLGLGETAAARQYTYRELFKVNLSDKAIHTIRQASHYNYPLGNDRFKAKIEATLARQVGQAKRGRPKRATTG